MKGFHFAIVSLVFVFSQSCFAQSSSPGPLDTKKDFSIQTKKNPNQNLFIGSDVKYFTAQFGLTQPRIVNENNFSYNYYSWKDLEAVCGTNSDWVIGIILHTPEYFTARGVHVGDSLEKAKKQYGVPKQKGNAYYYYKIADGVWNVIFYVDDKNVINQIKLWAGD
jgi:hypothetical protein